MIRFRNMWLKRLQDCFSILYKIKLNVLIIHSAWSCERHKKKTDLDRLSQNLDWSHFFAKILLLTKIFLDISFFAKTLRGQTLHWIGAKSCVCMFLDSRDKHVIACYNFVGKKKRSKINERTKEEQRERPFCGIRLHFPKSPVWSPNEFSAKYGKKMPLKIATLFK